MEINNFSDINLSNKKTLIICDIDNTLLYYEKNIDFFYYFLKNHMGKLNDEYLINEAKRLYNLYVNTNNAKPTDYHGFLNMISKYNVSLVFLTSRHTNSIELTKKHFNQIGLNYDKFIIHYTNNETTSINKGDYLLNGFIDMSNYEEIIFIDDNENCLESVQNLLPNIKCYKFVVNNINAMEFI